MSVLDTKWYRLLSYYSSLITATVSWVIACIPVVTFPAATAALLRDVAALTRESSTIRRRREWFREVRSLARRTAGLGAGLAALVVGSAMVASTTSSPLVAGGALAVFVFGVGSSFAVGFAIATGCLRLSDILRAVVVRALTVVAMSVPWVVAAVVLIVTPPTVAVPLWACSAGAAAAGSLGAARIASRVLRHRNTAPSVARLLVVSSC